MPAPRLAPAATAVLLILSGASHADSCDAVKAQIDDKVRSGGLSSFTLDIVDAAASAPGRNVGNCGGGARKIMMVIGAGRAAAPASASTSGSSANHPVAARVSTRRAAGKPGDNLLTECVDGSMSVGATCGK